MTKAAAQAYNIAAMVIFVASRFICTYLLKFVRPGLLLGACAIGGGLATLGTIFIQGYVGLYCLVAISAFMSLMFPTIYGIALRGVGNDAKLGSAGLICAIGGGCFMPPLQGLILDGGGLTLGAFALSATRASFFLPLLCFVVIAVYGFDCARRAARRGLA
jgi:FHS family L-fucose permease-like MFS transporter